MKKLIALIVLSVSTQAATAAYTPAEADNYQVSLNFQHYKLLVSTVCDAVVAKELEGVTFEPTQDQVNQIFMNCVRTVLKATPTTRLVSI